MAKTVITAPILKTKKLHLDIFVSYPDAQILLIKLFCVRICGSEIKLFWTCLEPLQTFRDEITDPAVPYNWISMSYWSTFRCKFVTINLHLLYRPIHPCLLFGTIHEASGDPCLIFRTPPLIGTREYIVV